MPRWVTGFVLVQWTIFIRRISWPYVRARTPCATAIIFSASNAFNRFFSFLNLFPIRLKAFALNVILELSYCNSCSSFNCLWIYRVHPNKAHNANDASSWQWMDRMMTWLHEILDLINHLLETIDFPCFWQKRDRPTNQPMDGPTDGQTDRPSYRDARTHLKMVSVQTLINDLNQIG